MTKNILITGGCGFIGAHFVRYLYNKYPNYHIFNLDLLTYAGNPENLADIEDLEASLEMEKKRYNFVKGNICDEHFIDELFKRYSFDLVVHFAAETHVDRSIFNVSDFVRTNIGGTHSLMETVRRHNTPRFIYISTDEVYGSTSDGVFIEESPLRPSNPYSTSKAGADLMVQSYIKTFRVPAIIVRPSNNYGTHQYPEKLIPLAITNFVEKRKIPVHGSGGHIRSWLHVEDLCSAIDLIAHEAPEFGIYNISGEERTNLEILKLLANFLCLDIDSYVYHVNDRPSADMRYAPDSTKLQKELGWFRKNNLESSMEKIVRWYMDNPVWWQKLKQKKEYLDHYEKQSKAQWY